jgi:hypothetical protein
MLKPLIYNSDIKELDEKMLEGKILSVDELSLVRQSTCSESQIQQACKRIFEEKFGRGFFQIDNGGFQSAAMKAKKKREGTIAGAPDVFLVGKDSKVFFVEFKRIGSPSTAKAREDQLEIHDFLRSLGFRVFLTNNTIFFEKIICKEFACTLKTIT